MNLKRLLEPTWAPQGTLCDLPLEVFSDRGIECLVLDVDCTLLPLSLIHISEPTRPY